MHLYSETALIFLTKVRAFSFEILKKEMGLPFQKKRLFYNNRYYPLDFVIFEHEKFLGEYDPNYYQIKINKNLIFHSNDHHLRNILRHELAHYITHIIFGLEVQAHGKEFQSVCQRFNFSKEISSASVELNKLSGTHSTLEETKILNKIKKLLRLSQSDNEYEATLATQKANDLLKAHNINFLESTDEEKNNETTLLRVMETKKITSKHQAIYKILHHFYVSPVFSYGVKSKSLEIIGERQNVLCAEYIAHFLDKTLEQLYSRERKKSGITGTRAKNSFMLGIAEGFCEKLSSNNQKEATDNNDLISLQQALQIHLNRVYPNIRGRQSKEKKLDTKARLLGKQQGKNISISPGITNKLKQKLLSYL